MDTWPSWCTKLEKYASLEAKSRPTLASLISDLEGCQKETNEGTAQAKTYINNIITVQEVIIIILYQTINFQTKCGKEEFDKQCQQ